MLEHHLQTWPDQLLDLRQQTETALANPKKEFLARRRPRGPFS